MPARPSPTHIARAEAKRLAVAINDFRHQLVQNKEQLTEVVETMAPGLMDLPGLGPITAAQVIVSYSHHGRVRSEAAFAALAGVSPIPASSGNNLRYRLNRHGDRQLDRALHTIAITRMMLDPATKAYVERRTTEGKSTREIRRSHSSRVVPNIVCATGRLSTTSSTSTSSTAPCAWSSWTPSSAQRSPCAQR
ncbi:hypothetical protein GCM10009691_21360 [Brevibacterium picturae]|uniref:Transposase IS116/IS110/IS902 C-terminal domain-containing protein n=1 Tax=Brevibacterium picturae TaxID=260553 RepID=A0ABP4ML33_9MICO